MHSPIGNHLIKSKSISISVLSFIILANASYSSDANKSRVIFRVKSREILKIFPGYKMRPSQGQKALPIGEWFESNHSWRATIQNYKLKQINGTWRVRDNMICVTPDDEKENCRFVWTNRETSKIYIDQVFSFSTASGPVNVDFDQIK